MKTTNCVWPALFGLLVACSAPLLAADTDRIRFDGEGNGQTATFEMKGPWLLDWKIQSEAPLLAVFEMRLHDATTNEYLGTLVELHGVGSGLKLFEEAGAFRISVAARNVAWALQVSEVSGEKAAEIKRLDAGQTTLKDSTTATMRLVREGTFSQWRPVGNEALLLFDSNGVGWRATFGVPCPGLESATAISFVTPLRGSLEAYDSILLDDGTRCYFERVVPTLVD